MSGVGDGMVGRSVNDGTDSGGWSDYSNREFANTFRFSFCCPHVKLLEKQWLIRFARSSHEISDYIFYVLFWRLML